MLDRIQAYFGVGKVYMAKKNECRYLVRASKELRVIIEHFDKYPLITQKRADYELFKQAVELMSQKEHLTPEGIQKIIAIKASVNLGLAEELKVAFPNTIPVPRPIVEGKEIKDPNWLSGFVSAEGCFLIVVKKKINFWALCMIEISNNSTF